VSASSAIFGGLVDCAMGLTASKESIELDEELDVGVITLCYLSVRVLDVVVVETGRVC
jgi:hypothetical protein